jgi:predicted nucleic acid-binding Zn ribbon protein
MRQSRTGRPVSRTTGQRSRPGKRWPGPGPGRPPEVSVGARPALDGGWQVDVAVGGVLGRWTTVVGSQVAEHCAPESFTDGVLMVRADSTAWATQVRLLVPMLLGRLGAELGDGVVTKVQVRGPGSPTWRRGRRTVSGRGPRDTYG